MAQNNVYKKNVRRYKRLKLKENYNTFYPFLAKTFLNNCNDVLKKMRSLDDKIVYTLNTSIPTESFKSKVNASLVCQDLFNQIQRGHSDREKIIKNCIVSTAETVKKLKAAKENSPDDIDVLKNLKTEQRKLRLLQTELSVEEVINEKTSKIFNEQCRSYYKPDNL